MVSMRNEEDDTVGRESHLSIDIIGGQEIDTPLDDAQDHIIRPLAGIRDWILSLSFTVLCLDPFGGNILKQIVLHSVWRVNGVMKETQTVHKEEVTL
jgi:hypothetical protein